MFTVKATYHGHTRKHTFSDTNTFPTYEQICHQVSLRVTTLLSPWRLNHFTSFIVCFLSPRTIIYQSSCFLLMLHNLLVSCSAKRFTTPSIITGVSASSQIVLGQTLCFGLLFLMRYLLLLSLWIVSICISIHFSFAYGTETLYQTQRHLEPTWIVPVDQCLYLSGLLCRHSWDLCHSKCPWMSTLWWPSHPVGATRMVARSFLLCLCRSISYPHKPLMFVAQCHKERLRSKPCYTTSRRTLIA